VGENAAYAQQVEFADSGELDGGLFANAPRPANSFDAPRSVPPPSRSPFDGLPSPAFDAKAGARSSFDAPGGAPRQQGFDAAPGRGGAAPFEAAPRFDGSQRPTARSRGNVVPFEPSSSPQADSSLAKTVGNWVMALLAVGALVYLMQVVFTRPDKRKKPDNSAQGAPPSAEDTQAERNPP
jgi:hypothetical protein